MALEMDEKYPVMDAENFSGVAEPAGEDPGPGASEWGEQGRRDELSPERFLQLRYTLYYYNDGHSQ